MCHQSSRRSGVSNTSSLISLLIYLLTYCLFNDAVSSSDCITSNGSVINACPVRNCKGYGKKFSCRNLRYYPRIFLGGSRKTTENLIQDSRYSGSDLNPGLSEYEVGMLTNLPLRLVKVFLLEDRIGLYSECNAIYSIDRISGFLRRRV
jgi:hypothetical protein